MFYSSISIFNRYIDILDNAALYTSTRNWYLRRGIGTYTDTPMPRYWYGRIPALVGVFSTPPTCASASIRLATTLSPSSVRMWCSVARLSLSFRSMKKPESFSSGDGGALWSSKFSTGMLRSKGRRNAVDFSIDQYSLLYATLNDVSFSRGRS